MALNVTLDFVKDELLENVSTAIKQLQMDSCQTSGKGDVHFTGNMWQVQDVCYQLDCILNHGLKQKSGGYWPFLKEITHKSTVDLVLSFPRAVTNDVRGWAWLFVALNECAIESYLRSLSSLPRIMERHYLPNALLRDGQRLQVLVMVVAGLEHLAFQLEPETACLRSWKSAISEIKYESFDPGDVEEADCASMASYDSTEAQGARDGDPDGDPDPEVAVIRMMSSQTVTESPCELTEDGGDDDDIVHSYTRATRRRRKERSSSTNHANNNNVYICADASTGKQKPNGSSRPPSIASFDPDGSIVTTPPQSDTASDRINDNCDHGLENVFIDTTNDDQNGLSNGAVGLEAGSCGGPPIEAGDSPSVVTLRANANGLRAAKEKRVSFNAENLIRTVEIRSPVDIPWDTLNGSTLGAVMSLYERGTPEGQEADPMTSSVTSGSVGRQSAGVVLSSPVGTKVATSPPPLRHGGRKGGGPPAPKLESSMVDRTVMESSSRMVAAEIASELQLALEGTKRRTVEGEVPLENNFHLMIMLEVIVDQQEKVYKVFRATIGHTVGSPADVFLILTDQRFYIAHWDDDKSHYVVDASFHFLDIEFLQLSLNYQVINIVCALPRQRHWICTGNEEVTRNIVTSLDVAIRRNPKIASPLCIFTDQTCHSFGIQKWVARITKREVRNTKVDLYCLVWWEDPHKAPDALNPLGPSIEGHLMYRYVGRSVFQKQNWKPGFFRLKAGVVYQSDDPIDRNFKSYVKLISGECSGCRRIPDGDRPYAFELVLSVNRSLQLAAPSETNSSEWLQALLQTVSSVHSEETFTSFRTPACLILAAQKLFVCHEELEISSLKSIGRADLEDVSAVYLDPGESPYCILEFESVEATQSSGDWLLYFPSHRELLKFVDTLDQCWQDLYKIPLSRHVIDDPIRIKRYRIQSKLLCRWEKTPHTP